MAAIAVSKTPQIFGLQLSAASAVFNCCRRYESSDSVVRGQHSNMAAYKRGTGGRSSFSGLVATVFGASGFVGSAVVNKLGKIGSQVVVPYQSEPYYVKDLKLAGDLGQILFLPYSMKDEDTIRQAMQYSNVVINLAAREWPTRNFSLKDINVDAARRVARIAKEMSVERLIHFSHLNASPDPPAIMSRKGSDFLKSKYEGEMSVREEFPEAIIFRPSDIFGENDRFINYYAMESRHNTFGFIPMWKGGNNTVKKPVFLTDVAQGVINAIRNPDTDGKTFECVGPGTYVLGDLVKWMYECMRYSNPTTIPVTPLFKLKMKLISLKPTNYFHSNDRLRREFVSDITTGNPTLEDLGVQLKPIEDFAPHVLKYYRKWNYYDAAVGEFPDPAPPPQILPDEPLKVKQHY